jgi:hypothetical protein
MKHFPLLAACLWMLAGAHVLCAAVDPAQAVVAHFTEHPEQRVTGRAMLVHTLWKKAISEQAWEKGQTFANEQQKTIAKAMVTAGGGVDFALKQDQTLFEVLRVLRDHEKVRKELLVVDEKQAAACKSAAEVEQLFKQSPPDVYSYKGSWTMVVVRDQSTPGFSALVEPDKIWVPEFWTWGVGGRGGNQIVAMIRSKKMNLSAEKRDGLVHATITMGKAIKWEMVIDPSKDNCLIESSVGTPAGGVLTKTVCDQYVQTPGGPWFPMVYRKETYVFINGKPVLSQREEYRAIPGSVDLDTPLPADAFAVKLAPGTHVSDMRTNPSTEVVIPPGKDVFEGP